MAPSQTNDCRTEPRGGSNGRRTSAGLPIDEYAARVDTARKAVAVAMAVCGFGLVLSANLRIGPLAVLCWLGVCLCVLAAFGFAIEYVIRTWVETRNPELAPYQFSLAGIFVLVTCAAVLFSSLKILGGGTLWLLVLGVVAFACITELVRRANRADQLAQNEGPQRQHPESTASSSRPDDTGQDQPH